MRGNKSGTSALIYTNMGTSHNKKPSGSDVHSLYMVIQFSLSKKRARRERTVWNATGLHHYRNQQYRRIGPKDEETGAQTMTKPLWTHQNVKSTPSAIDCEKPGSAHREPNGNRKRRPKKIVRPCVTQSQI